MIGMVNLILNIYVILQVSSEYFNVFLGLLVAPPGEYVYHNGGKLQFPCRSHGTYVSPSGFVIYLSRGEGNAQF